jgi:hypothetical protein
MIIEVNGQQVEVDDSFASLPPEQQQAELAYITKSMSPAESSVEVRGATEEDLVNPLYATIAGGIAGELAGPMVNKGVEAMRKGAPAASAALNVPGSAGGAAPGQKFAAKTGYGSGPGYTVQEVVEHQKAQAKPIGSGKISGKIAGNTPMNIDKMMQLEAAQKAEAARRAAALAPTGMMAKLPEPVQAAGRFVGGMTQSGVTPWLGRGLAGAGVGFQGSDAYNRFQQGDYPGAAISGLGALGSAASFIPNPVTRVGGAAIGVGAEALNMYLDSLKKKVEQQPVPAQAPVQMAAGGLAGYGIGGKIEKAKDVAKKMFDPRFDKRVREIAKLENQVRNVEPTTNIQAPKIYLPDYEGHPFVTSMSDRTDASGKLLGLNNRMFENPIDLTGGQGYMFDSRNPGKVWESGKGPSSAILKSARAAKDFTGMDPIYLPWRMAPTGSDFSPMTGETMLAHAQSAMSGKEISQIDDVLKNIIPNWQGVNHPESFKQFGNAPTAARKAAQRAMDKHFRNEGGLGLGEARLAISDPNQIAAPEGGLQNIGRIFSEQSLIKSGEKSRYPYGVPGEGLGTLDREINIAQLLPKWVQERGIQDVTAPRHTDMRSLQMKPYSGILTDKILMDAGFKHGGLV